MPTDYQQTDASGSANPSNSAVHKWIMSAGAAAGSISRSANVGSRSAIGADFNMEYETQYNASTINTATWAGTCVMRLNVTTANTNVNWQRLDWYQACGQVGDSSSTYITQTTGLAINFGTTGVKTASVTLAVTFNTTCSNLSAAAVLMLAMSGAATMSATFNYISNQLVTLPFVASAAPAASITFTLAQLGVGN